MSNNLPTERLPSTGVRLSDLTQRNSGPFSSREVSECFLVWSEKLYKLVRFFYCKRS